MLQSYFVHMITKDCLESLIWEKVSKLQSCIICILCWRVHFFFHIQTLVKVPPEEYLREKYLHISKHWNVYNMTSRSLFRIESSKFSSTISNQRSNNVLECGTRDRIDNWSYIRWNRILLIFIATEHRRLRAAHNRTAIAEIEVDRGPM